MYFNIKEGGLVCNSCIAKDKEGCIKVSLYFNKLVRKILITPLSTISSAIIPDKKMKELEKITDLYIAYHSEKSFKTDRFLKSL
jgi:DNA repair protein RecO (recombination protein O)